MTGINFIAGFVKYKLYSIYLGIKGLGILSQLTSTISFLTYLLPLGFPMGITKIVAQKINKDHEVIVRLLKTILIVLAIPTIIAMIFMYFFSEELSVFLFDENTYSSYIKILSLYVPFLIGYSIVEAFIKGIGEITLYVKSTIISSIVATVILVPLVIYFGVVGAIYGMIINYIVFVVFCIVRLKSFEMFRDYFRNVKFDSTIVKEILGIGVAFLVAGAIYQATMLYLKKMTIESFGIEGNGLFQSILNISLFYFGFIFTSLSSYSFPKIAKMDDNSELTSEMNSTMRFILLLMVPLIVILIIFRNYILIILYTSDFVVAESFFRYQFFGDFFKALSWVLGIWLIPRSKLFIFVAIDLVLNFNLLFVYYLTINFTSLGVTGVSVAYLSAYVFHFIINLIFASKLIGFRFNKQNLKLINLSVLVILIITLLSFQSMVVGYIFFIPILGIWFFMNVSKNEMQQSIEIVRNFLVKKN